MAGGIGHGGVFKVFGFPIPECSTRGGELNATQTRGGNSCRESGVLGPGSALQALENGGVLRVRGQQPAAAFLQFRQHHRSRCDQRFLVGQGQVLASANSGEGRQQACTSHNPGDDQIRALPRGCNIQAIGTAHKLRTLSIAAEGVEPLLQLREKISIGQSHQLGLVTLDLLHQ